MKKFITILLVIVTTTFYAQDYNTKKGYIAEGYDVVAYFSNKALKGDKKFKTEFEGVKYKFTSQENLETFTKNPKKYIPQYGGYCAYAIGKKGKKVSIDPKTFEIREGKLYLFYNSWGTNTLELWTKEGAEKLKNEADKNWIKIHQ
ncbi:YHS domain-containing (seleno)protein [Polaribacter porphyrae]|uniref:YHS domain-containing protein n=1 Tax=Polaribacter porphyrae TaxID=1137780 RepID=A0A2S7WR14_9FLAO|nr:YHS domain-containing (seleno)protein [Polaribacter porphyrae]PQJ80029.1 hypothetical protein BTO18_12980 [Polaribacter porphyrae]